MVIEKDFLALRQSQISYICVFFPSVAKCRSIKKCIRDIMEVGEMGDGDESIQTSNYKMNMFYQCHVHGDYS